MPITRNMSSTTNVKVFTQEEYLDAVLSFVLEEGFNVAIWKKPKEDQIEILIDRNQQVKKLALQLDELPSGFVLHPFADQLDHKSYFLEAHHYLKIPVTGSIEGGLEEFLSDEHDIPLKNHIKKLLRKRIAAKVEDSFSSTKTAFIQQVEKGIEMIQAGKLIKIVPARAKHIDLTELPDISSVFLSLCSSYPNAFVNFIHTPTQGTWIGASPEVLIKTEEQIFSTMALAGTQRAVGENPLKNAAWTQKEIEEQALVSRYIVNCFKKIRLREYEERGPKTVLAGNLLHLRSDFIVDMEATSFPHLGTVMLDLLHPTSAVCGMPRDKALSFLKEHETFERSLFSGFIGPVNIENTTSIYVNLRTAQILESKVILYAGAGVTEESIPEKEWEETEMKCDIIGKFLIES